MSDITFNHQYELRLLIHKGNKKEIVKLLKEEPYCSNLNEILSYQDIQNHTSLYELCDIQYESIFLDIAPFVSKELWLCKTVSGADMLLKAVASGSIEIFNCVYNTGLFSLERIHEVVLCSNCPAIIEKVHELGVDYTNQFLFNYVEIEHLQEESVYLAIDAINELFKDKYHINPHLVDDKGNNAMHQMLRSICKEDKEIIPLLSWFIKKGVNILDKNHDGKTILDYALVNHRKKDDVVLFLLNQEAFQNAKELERAWKEALKDAIFRVSDTELLLKERIRLLTEKTQLHHVMIDNSHGKFETKTKNKL